MVWGHFLAPKDWSCKSEINLRPNFDGQIAEKRMQKKILMKKCKILPTIRSAEVALRCETCSIFISVTEFREFYILQLFLSQDFNQSSPWFQTSDGRFRWQMWRSGIPVILVWRGKESFLNFGEILSGANLLKRDAAACSGKTNKQWKRHSTYIFMQCNVHIHKNETAHTLSAEH